MPIKRLSVELANQIAAGEVVERPASVVKELLENARDAGATKIRCEIEDAGRRRILVRDDGAGISGAELPLALAPHATSKISVISDLDAIATLGFRGEALASIAAVSRLTLTSRARGAEAAYAVEVEGADQEPRVFAAAHPEGTTVEVRELFFNTPARRRFLKSARSEIARIRDLIIRTALVAPELTLDLISDHKLLLHIDPAPAQSDQAARLRSLLGSDFAKALPVQLDDPALTVRGWLVEPPPEAASLGDLVYIFLNGRALSDRLLLRAAKSAITEADCRSPTLRTVLFLTCPYAAVDVNVHPHKDEVRFHDERQIHDRLREALFRALEGASAGTGLPAAGPVALPHALPPLPGTARLFPEARGSTGSTGSTGAVGSTQATAGRGAGAPIPRSERLRRESDHAATVAERAWELARGGAEPAAGAETSDRAQLVLALSPQAVLLECGQRYFLVSTAVLRRHLEGRRLVAAWEQNRVRGHDLALPVSFAISPEVKKALKPAREEALRLGFEFKIRGQALTLLRIPEQLRGHDLTRTCTGILNLIAASAPALAGGRCPDQLVDLICADVRPGEDLPRLLQAVPLTPADLSAWGEACRELPLNRWAAELKSSD